jgi:uncharacterized protein (DUF1501 family)
MKTDSMNRRLFLRRALPAGTLPFLLGGFSIQAFGRSPLLEAVNALAAATDRVLVLIQLNGGNDGLNMVIPRDQYAALAAARQNIMIPEAKVLPLTDLTGLHPMMTGLQALYQEGKVAVVQSVGYPSPNFSHFRATDIWLSGSDSNQILSTGWLGRYLDQEFPGYPTGYPNTGAPDPLAIQVGSVVSMGFMGPSVNMGVAVTNPNSTYTLPGGDDTPPETPAGHELIYLRQIAQQTQVYSTAVRTAAAGGSTKSTLFPAAGTNTLADQLKIVAQLIVGGLDTRVYIVTLGGFDTHSAQVVGGATDTGTHATLLQKLSIGITAFMDELHLQRQDDRVLGMTYSEFGRRIKSNASAGTDHGSAAPVFVFGSLVNGGIIGNNPALPAAATVNDNISMQYDFRMVYASILRDWFGASLIELQSVLPNHADTVPLIQTSALLRVEKRPQTASVFALDQNYPNPFNPATRIGYTVGAVSSQQTAVSSHVRLAVYDLLGREVAVLVDEVKPPGNYVVEFDGSGLASGVYLYRLVVGGFSETKRMTLVR